MFPRFGGQTFGVRPYACESPSDIVTLYDFMQQKLEFAINPHSRGKELSRAVNTESACRSSGESAVGQQRLLGTREEVRGHGNTPVLVNLVMVFEMVVKLSAGGGAAVHGQRSEDYRYLLSETTLTKINNAVMCEHTCIINRLKCLSEDMMNCTISACAVIPPQTMERAAQFLFTWQKVHCGYQCHVKEIWPPSTETPYIHRYSYALLQLQYTSRSTTKALFHDIESLTRDPHWITRKSNDGFEIRERNTDVNDKGSPFRRTWDDIIQRRLETQEGTISSNTNKKVNKKIPNCSQLTKFHLSVPGTDSEKCSDCWKSGTRVSDKKSGRKDTGDELDAYLRSCQEVGKYTNEFQEPHSQRLVWRITYEPDAKSDTTSEAKFHRMGMFKYHYKNCWFT
ncbi:hypothetical protein WN51_09765 [Melipona quadrifasciata]|uniref:Uncharacterized protein n=1 Tax=Melipona quadrifasciata TaxID=166423 RepID=A0A0N0BIH1_9HYME|nr:hypothetical protein WN51_09765 [Melipona quadrifasciata]